jgi:hypothetical protein
MCHTGEGWALYTGGTVVKLWAQEGETEEAEVKEDEGESDKEEVEV